MVGVGQFFVEELVYLEYVPGKIKNLYKKVTKKIYIFEYDKVDRTNIFENSHKLQRF